MNALTLPMVLTAVTAGLMLAVLTVIGWGRVQSWRHQRLTSEARWVTIAAPAEVDATSARSLWQTLAGVLTPARTRRLIYGTPHVAWEYIWAGRHLTIRIWVPGTIPPGAVEAAVAAAWPAATWTTTPAEPPIPTSPTGLAASSTPGSGGPAATPRRSELIDAGGAWWPAQVDAVPLRTDHDGDPLRPLLAAGATLHAREHACVQVLARPATPRRIRATRQAAHTIADSATSSGVRHPASAAPAAVTAVARWTVEAVLAVLEVFLPGRSTTRTATSPARTVASRDPFQDAGRRSVVDKVASIPHYEIAIRYAVATHLPDGPANSADSRSFEERRTQVRDRMTGLAHTLASASATYTRPNTLRRMRMAHPVHVLASRRLGRGFVVTVEELAALAALPQDVAVPGLDRARAAAVPAPVSVPSGGRGVKVIGRAHVGGQAVGLAVPDGRQHVHLIGKTGVGKTTVLLNMILADIHAHRGVVVIDPRGDLITDILDRIPATFADRVHLIDPDQPNSDCFNPLETGPDADAHLAVDNLVGIFAKIFQRHWGPRIDDTLRVSCLTLMRYATPTLALIPPLLNDRVFRARFTTGLTDPEGLGGFWTWYDSMNDGLRAQVIGPVLARLRAFLLRDFVKDVIGTTVSSFRMSDVLNGGILLCRLPKGILGEDTARILGSLIVARTWQAAIARASIPENKRRDATLYIDEAQNFLNLPGSVDDMLAEARGFHLGLVLAHQNLAQLPAETLAALSANARSKIIFTIDPDDARQLSKHTLPELSEHDLAHLDVFTAVARLIVSGRELPAFTFTTQPPPEPLGQADVIRASCARARTARVDGVVTDDDSPTGSGAPGSSPSRRPRPTRWPASPAPGEDRPTRA
ncbi:MAG: hypothetical protein QG597_4637 [Actinomycetota bacterium]|nr:hypothetical protein [Actinomycetota bacterium]